VDAFDDIGYSNYGLAGRDLFLAEYSDVVFYFEDADYEPVYEKLISIIAPEHFSTSVFCLGGKTEVLKKAKTENDISKPRVFIVDKDFDDILNEKQHLTGLIYLERYCLENYLLSMKAIASVIIDRFTLSAAAFHAKCADYDVFLKRLLLRYEELTRLFIVSRKFRLKIPTTGLEIDELVAGEQIADILPDDIISAYKEKLLASTAVDCDWITDGVVLDELVNCAFDEAGGGKPVTDHFCGKHLFGLIGRYLKAATGIDASEIPSASLYMDVMGRIDGLADAFKATVDEINQTITQQRTELYQR